MIPEPTARKIRELRSAGRTQAAIARELGVSRTTVGRVLHGRWKPRRFNSRRVLRLLELWDTLLSLNPGGTYVGWCGACREPVHLPCVACLARMLAAFGLWSPSRWLEDECQCARTFTGQRPPPREPTVRRRS